MVDDKERTRAIDLALAQIEKAIRQGIYHAPRQ